MKLPEVFIGSSGRAYDDIAREIASELAGKARPTLWKNGFDLGDGTLERLMKLLDRVDFAVLLLTADDTLTRDAASKPSPRDNVVFELGLFMGRLGRERTFIVKEAVVDLVLPTDLLGITVSSIERPAHGDWRSAASMACTPILRSIRELGPASSQRVETFADVNAAFNEFGRRLSEGRLKVVSAQMVQHSSEQASGFVRRLAKAGAQIDLFLQNPKSAVQLGPAARRIEARITGYVPTLLETGYRARFRIFLYDAPAAVDAVRLIADDGSSVLILGWYAYYHSGPVRSFSDCQVNGAEKPCFAIASAHPDFKPYEEFFDDLLRNHRSHSGERPEFEFPQPAG